MGSERDKAIIYPGLEVVPVDQKVLEPSAQEFNAYSQLGAAYG